MTDPASDLFDLHGTGALVTGAARGIGRAAALCLAERGASLTLFDRDEEELQRSESMINERGGTCRIVVGDVTSSADIERLSSVTNGDHVSVVVNCAGVVRRTDIRDMTLVDLDHLWNVNLRGTVAVTQQFLPRMIEQGRGKVINMGSLGSVLGLQNRTAYATTKGAVALYTKSLALEVAQYGINVNAIGPGYIETDMTSDWLHGDSERTASLLERIPANRFGTTNDLEGLFLFLASRASDYVTGQLIMIDGGWTTN